MKFIYDEEEAKKRKEDYDGQIEEENKHHFRCELIATVLAILFVLGALIVGCLGHFGVLSFIVSGICCCICIIGIAVSIVVGLRYAEQSTPYDFYDDAAWYYEKTNRFNILQVIMNKKPGCIGTGCLEISADLEDKNGNVKNTDLCILRKQVSTAVPEEVADVMNGVWYVPYEKEEKESEDKGENCEN